MYILIYRLYSYTCAYTVDKNNEIFQCSFWICFQCIHFESSIGKNKSFQAISERIHNLKSKLTIYFVSAHCYFCGYQLIHSTRLFSIISIQLHACGSWHCCVNVRPKSPPATPYPVKGAHLHVPHHASLLASLLWRGTRSPSSRSFCESSLEWKFKAWHLHKTSTAAH